ncbi:MAG: phosphotransferase [Solirubrobacteraceae bacterium]
MPDTQIASLVARLEPALGPLSGEPVPLDGGITNRNFRVVLGDGEYVVRIAGRDTSLLGISRTAERDATAAAAAAGVAPEVAAFLEDAGCLVTRFIPGRPVTTAELVDDGPLGEVAAALRAIHGGPALPTRFDAFRLVEQFRATALERGGDIPAAYGRAQAIAGAIEPVLVGPEHRLVPCHNDLLTANFIHDGTRVRIVDWEYAGMGDRYFDLANLSVNNGFDEAADARLLGLYFEEAPTPRRFACLRLMRVMSDFREAMWGVVQTTVSELDFDFAAYAAEHFARLEQSAADPRFPTWLEDARGH